MSQPAVMVMNPPPTTSCCCFSIPEGGRKAAIIEIVFIVLTILASIIMFIGGDIGNGAVTMIFCIALLITAVFFLKGVGAKNGNQILPYCIVKIIHLVWQGVSIIWYIVIAVGASLVTAATQSSLWNVRGENSQFRINVNDDELEKARIWASVLLAAAIILLILTVVWFILGIIFVVVGFKCRNHFNQQHNPQMAGVVVSQPAYAQQPQHGYAMQPGYPQPPPTYEK